MNPGPPFRTRHAGLVFHTGALAIAILTANVSCAAPAPLTLIEAVETTAAKLHSLEGSPGFGYALIRDGRTLHAAGVGYSGPMRGDIRLIVLT
jgi:hypothetical protein